MCHIQFGNSVIGAVIVLQLGQMAYADISEFLIVPDIKAFELCILGYVQFRQSVAEAIQSRTSGVRASGFRTD